MIVYLLGRILTVEAVLMAPSAVLAAIYGEGDLKAFLFTMLLLAVVGVALSCRRPKNSAIFAREGLVTVAAAWILISAFGALPMVISGAIPSYVDALFEMISGFTTTGASILPQVETLPHGVLFWRSFSHWVGGMGVLVFVMAVVPMSDNRSMVLMRAEVPGPVAGKLVPRMRSTAKLLYGVYSVMTVVLIVLLLFGGMPMFDAICVSLGTAGTGGFGNWNDSIAHYNSAYLQNVISVFMILFGINFNAYFLLLTRKFKQLFKIEEIRVYLGVIAVFTTLIAFNVRGCFGSLRESFHHSLFQVASIITTTGFSSCDFDLWPTLSKEILVMLMFVGACAGSTGGGMKVSRILILGKTLKKELKQALHPQVVAPARMDGKLLNHETIRATNVYVAAYIFIFAASFLLISLDGFDMVTNFTAIAATLNNIGPGLNQVGPMMNFGSYSNPAKLVMIFDMLAGRLEIFPMLVFFLPDTWRRF